MTANNVVMWETMHNNAGWDCFRTLTLPEILKSQNRLQGRFCAYLEVTHSFQHVGCVRSKLVLDTVQRNLKLFLLAQEVCAWTVFLLLIFGIWLLKCCMHDTPPRKQTKTKSKLQLSTTIMSYATSIKFRRTRSHLNLVRCSTFFEDNEAVINVIIKAEVQQ